MLRKIFGGMFAITGGLMLLAAVCLLVSPEGRQAGMRFGLPFFPCFAAGSCCDGKIKPKSLTRLRQGVKNKSPAHTPPEIAPIVTSGCLLTRSSARVVGAK